MKSNKSHNGVSILLFLSILFFHSFAPAAETTNRSAIGLSINDAINIALVSNKSVQMQKTEIKSAAAEKMYAFSSFLPKASVNYGYTYNNSVLSSTDIPGKRKDPRIFEGYKNDNQFSVTAEQEIFAGGANIADFKQANINLRSQEETLRATILEIEFETHRLFYGILLAYETELIALDLVKQARLHYKEVEAKHMHGTASRFDVLQSKVQVARLMPQLIDAESSRRLIMVQFKKLLALNMGDEVKIEGVLKCAPVKIREEEFLMEAYENRPEMKLKSLGVDIEKWGIEFAKSTGVPQVSGSFAYSARSDDVGNMINKRHDNWNVGFKVSIPLFDGFATAAKINEARAKYAHARLDKDDYVDQVAVDVKQACLNLQKAQSVIDAQKDSIMEATEALRLSEVRYNNGVGINLDVFDSQVALAQVKQNLAGAYYDYIMAKADLGRVMGREFFKEE
ncbi:MAG: TolC family protein [Candidatus Omnitrophica bacterium]|nr:TolC family protein [Candidatus Omnitrophota bacterium]